MWNLQDVRIKTKRICKDRESGMLEKSAIEILLPCYGIVGSQIGANGNDWALNYWAFETKGLG